jgi:hypothetical protein
VHRTLRDGLYFPLVDILREPFAKVMKPTSDLGHVVVHTLAGNFAGATNGVLLNGLVRG